MTNFFAMTKNNHFSQFRLAKQIGEIMMKMLKVLVVVVATLLVTTSAFGSEDCDQYKSDRVTYMLCEQWVVDGELEAAYNQLSRAFAESEVRLKAQGKEVAGNDTAITKLDERLEVVEQLLDEEEPEFILDTASTSSPPPPPTYKVARTCGELESMGGQKPFYKLMKLYRPPQDQLRLPAQAPVKVVVERDGQVLNPGGWPASGSVCLETEPNDHVDLVYLVKNRDGSWVEGLRMSYNVRGNYYTQQVYSYVGRSYFTP
jgi:hypothetical protein